MENDDGNLKVVGGMQPEASMGASAEAGEENLPANDESPHFVFGFVDKVENENEASSASIQTVIYENVEN